MFTTLRYNSLSDEPIRVERRQFANVANSGRGLQHVACKNCRAKKLRCGGQKPGCDRCQTKSIPCIYGGQEDKEPRSKAAKHSRWYNRSGHSTPESSRTASGVENDKGGTSGNRGKGNPKTDTASPEDNAENSEDAATESMRAPENWMMEEIEEVGSSFSGYLEMAGLDPFNDSSNTGSRPSPFQIGGSGKARPDQHFMQDHGQSQFHPGLDWNSYLSDESNSDTVYARTDIEPYLLPAESFGNNENFPRASTAQNNAQGRDESLTINSPDFSTTQTLQPQLPLREESQIHSQVADSCRCLLDVVQFLEKLELKNEANEQVMGALDTILSFQKSAVERCIQMLDCSLCKVSSERMVMLALMGDKLVTEFVKALTAASRSKRQDPPPAKSSFKPDEFTLEVLPTPPPETCTASLQVSPENSRRKLHLGDYEITSCYEWSCLLNILLNLQSRRLNQFISRAKSWATTTNRDAQLAMFVKLEHRFQAATSHLSGFKAEVFGKR